MNGKKSLKKERWLSLLLIVCTIFWMMGAVAVPAFAEEYEDGYECDFCGKYNWRDGTVCGDCANCTEESNWDCFNEHHCIMCQSCIIVNGNPSWCFDSGFPICDNCLEEGAHCRGCDACIFEDNAEICKKCKEYCSECASICPDCGRCDYCTSERGHCEVCGACGYSCYFGGEHCDDCCEICALCHRCAVADDSEICFDCEACEECCLEQSEAAGCSCGMCVASADWEDHFCDQCDACFDDVETCDTCGLCVDCCEANSECSDGMCVEDPDYAAHLCESCGTCFHEVDPCDTCESGRCQECCAELAALAGCDCETWCPEDPAFEAHLDANHSGEGIGEHEATPKKAWTYNALQHWHECRFCDELEHVTELSGHHYDESGLCKECKHRNGSKVYILKQPKDFKGLVSNANAGSTDPAYMPNNLATFTVEAEGWGILDYQWYVQVKGSPVQIKLTEPSATTKTLVTEIPEDACTTKYTYFCIVVDEKGNVAETEAALLRAGHRYESRNVPQKGNEVLATLTYTDGTTEAMYSTIGHNNFCVGSYCNDKGKAEFGNAKDHTFGAYTNAKATTDGKEWKVRTCEDCGYRQFKAVHTHIYLEDITGATMVTPVESQTNDYKHVLQCNYPGCEHTQSGAHQWEAWRIASYPEGSTPGGMRRECSTCQYPQNELIVYDADDNKVEWTTGSALVQVVGGEGYPSIVRPGDKVKVWASQEDQKIRGWKVTYFRKYNSGAGIPTKDFDVSADYTMTRREDGKWSGTVPAFPASVGGGGILVFEPIFETCTHENTQLDNVRVEVCMKEGYTGDMVCTECGHIVSYGSDIAAPGYHQGTFELVPGTAVVGDCTHRGYEGDLKCTACGYVKQGETTGFVHGAEEIRDFGPVKPSCDKEGYSGDVRCADCDKVLRHGKDLPPEHPQTDIYDEVEATCTDSGFSGNIRCTTCHEIVEAGKETKPLGHAWGPGIYSLAPTHETEGSKNYYCSHEGCSAVKKEATPKLEEELRFIEGMDGEWILGSTGTMFFKTTGDLTYFTGLYVDGVKVPSTEYTSDRGSTLLNLKDSYMNTLAEGTHTIKTVYIQTSCETTFTVKASNGGGNTPGGGTDPGTNPGGGGNTPGGGGNNPGGNTPGGGGTSGGSSGGGNAGGSTIPGTGPVIIDKTVPSTGSTATTNAGTQTGDSTATILWTTAFGASLLSLTGMIVWRRRRERRESREEQ